jgi:hypothetical protein
MHRMRSYPNEMVVMDTHLCAAVGQQQQLHGCGADLLAIHQQCYGVDSFNTVHAATVRIDA